MNYTNNTKKNVMKQHIHSRGTTIFYQNDDLQYLEQSKIKN